MSSRISANITGVQLLAAPQWYAMLGELLSMIGNETFPARFASTLRSLVDFDYTVTFAYNGPDVPVCLHHTFQPHRFQVHVTEYEIGPYLLDPFYKATANGTRAGLYHLAELAPDQFFKSEYYRSYYVQTGPVDEIAFFIPGNTNWAIVTSLMRSSRRAVFSKRERTLLRSVEPLMRGIAELHWRTDDRLKEIRTEQDERAVLHRAVEEALQQRGIPPLTPREMEVVGLVLEGHSSESIAKLLEISAGTVRIHRKNIYAKMRISSQRELFAIFMRSPAIGVPQ